VRAFVWGWEAQLRYRFVHIYVTRIIVALLFGLTKIVRVVSFSSQPEGMTSLYRELYCEALELLAPHSTG